MSETVLKIEGLSKDYKMFARKKDRIIETLFPGVERHGEIGRASCRERV